MDSWYNTASGCNQVPKYLEDSKVADTGETLYPHSNAQVKYPSDGLNDWFYSV